MLISEQLEQALELKAPPSADGLLVKVARLRHEDYPGRDAHGVIPVLVMGHKDMKREAWARWVRENGVAGYGPAMTERFLSTGVDLKEMVSTGSFGRAMRTSSRQPWRSKGQEYSFLDRAAWILDAVEKWPSLYNVIVTEMAEEEMTLRMFVDRVFSMPTPLEMRGGVARGSTLGDLIGPRLAYVGGEL